MSYRYNKRNFNHKKDKYKKDEGMTVIVRQIKNKDGTTTSEHARWFQKKTDERWFFQELRERGHFVSRVKNVEKQKLVRRRSQKN